MKLSWTAHSCLQFVSWVQVFKYNNELISQYDTFSLLLPILDTGMNMKRYQIYHKKIKNISAIICNSMNSLQV